MESSNGPYERVDWINMVDLSVMLLDEKIGQITTSTQVMLLANERMKKKERNTDAKNK